MPGRPESDSAGNVPKLSGDLAVVFAVGGSAHRSLILGQCSGPGGIVFLSRLIACVMRRQTAKPVSSPADASSSGRCSQFVLCRVSLEHEILIEESIRSIARLV